LARLVQHRKASQARRLPRRNLCPGSLANHRPWLPRKSQELFGRRLNRMTFHREIKSSEADIRCQKVGWHGRRESCCGIDSIRCPPSSLARENRTPRSSETGLLAYWWNSSAYADNRANRSCTAIHRANAFVQRDGADKLPEHNLREEADLSEWRERHVHNIIRFQ
jgi:hypothetical protein